MIPADTRKARVDGGELRRPGQPSVTFDGPQAAALAVHVTRFERARGGVMEVTVAGALRDGIRVEAVLSTFVRDVVRGSALLGPARLGLGDAGRMR